MTTYRTYRCPSCNAPSHPSCGCQYGPDTVYCWSCTVEFWRWMQHWTNMRTRHPDRPDFYAAAGRHNPRNANP